MTDVREPITNEELGEWAKLRADDAGHLARELVVARPLIRELVAALTEFLEFGEYAYSHGREALAKAKAAGYEPAPTLGKVFPGNEP